MIKSNILTSDYLLDNSLEKSTQLPVSELLHHNLQEEDKLEPAFEISTETESEENIFVSNLSVKSYPNAEKSQLDRNRILESALIIDGTNLLKREHNHIPTAFDKQNINNRQLTLNTINSSFIEFDGDSSQSDGLIFGEDGRTRVSNTKTFPFSAVGLLNSNGGSCSGAMISPFHFLTAGHCLTQNTPSTTDGNQQEWNSGGYEIALGATGSILSDGRAANEYYGRAGWTYRRTFTNWFDNGENMGWDIGLITLDRNIGDHTGWFGYGYNNNFANNTLVNKAGYPGDLQDSDGDGTRDNIDLIRQSGRITSTTTDELRSTDLDNVKGNSGGPVWVYNSDTLERTIYGVTSYFTNDGSHNGYARITKSKFDALQNWIEEDIASRKPVDKPDFVDYDDWFGTDFAYFKNNTTGGFRDDLSNSTLDVGVGDSVTFRSVIRNNGTAKVDGFYLTEPKVNVSFYASTNEIISSYDDKIGEVNLSAIDSFDWSNATLNTAFPDIPEGQYYIGYQVDSIMSEFKINNNKGMIDGSKINVIHEKDLSGYSFDVVQEPLNAGDTFDVNFAVENSENYSAGQFTVNFYLSDNSTITTSDRFLGSHSITSLAGNSNTGTLTTSLALPDASDSVWNGDGDYHIGMIVDALSQVKETNEFNNNSRGELIDYDKVSILTSSDLIGTSTNDLLSGTLNDDIIKGLEGKDTLYGDEGNDTLYGGKHNDRLYGDEDDDSLYGDSGRDKLYGGTGNDFLYGGDDKDNLDGGDGNDQLYGESGDDRLKGKDGDDELFGGLGKDKLNGGHGNDYLAGGADDDKLDGDRGDDNLVGDSGNDTLKGGHGDDLLSGDWGNDVLDGGSGADEFIFYSWDEGTDIIKDFDWQEGDLITIYQSGFGANAQFSYETNNGDLFFNGSDTINGTHHIATLANNPSDFDINSHLNLV